MAIDIQQPNYSGLVAIAGKSAPLNVQPTGALGLQALQQQQANDAALRASALGRAQLQQQGELALQSQNIQQQAMDQQAQQQQRQGLLDQSNLAMRQQEFGAAGIQNAAENAYKQKLLAQQGATSQGNIDVEKAKLFQEHQKQEMLKAIEEKKETIQEKGAYAAYAAMSMKNAKSPEEAQQIRAAILEEGLKKGYYSKEQVKQASQLPLSQFTALTSSEVIKWGAAKEYKDMQDKSASSRSGTHMEFDENGNLASISIDPTAAMKTEAQKDLKAREIGLQQLAGIREKFDPALFTYAGKAARGASAVAELSKGIPGLEQATELAAQGLTGQNPEERGLALQNANAYLNSVEQFFNTYRKDITGAAAAEKELERLRASFINSDLSPSQFKGALDQLLVKYTSEAEFNKNILRSGLDTSPRGNEAERQKLKELKNPDGSRKYTDQDIDNYYNKAGK